MRFTPGSPADRGFRMPAEWEPHAATWITWPHFEGTWPGKLDLIAPIYVEMVRALHTGETVHINALDEDRAAGIRELLAQEGILNNVVVHVRPTDNEWIRDYGAIFVVRDGDDGRQRLATDWQFNNWGEKYPDFEHNNQVPAFMAEATHTDREAYDLIMEGGSIDVNGQGWLLTTEQCLLNPNRNPDRSREEIEQALRDAFGVREILWLGDGVEGDDTDGHIDDLTRFVDAETVVTVVEDDPDDPNHEPLEENLKRLRSMRPEGKPLRIVEIPLPRPLFHEGERLPASYANFYVGNEVVLLPTFDDPADLLAEQQLQAAFPHRRIVPIDTTDLVWGFGAFHCLTQQEPAR
jgi:agmatine deiminase